MPSNTTHVTEIGGIPADEHATFVIRGRNKGQKAKPIKCGYCGDEIAVGEQYFNIDGWPPACLGCAKYS